MPVTAKLSRKFYEALGDEVANELVEWFNAVDLTYRTDLRALNDSNHARFEARLGEGVATLRADLDSKIAELRADLQAGLAEVRAELDVKLTEFRAEVDTGFTEFRADFGIQLAGLRTELKQDLADTRANLIKWMFVFWLGTVAASVASRFF
ncbi:MAG: hypothetical protein R2909_09685 [Gemmatimonadales bacterium]